MRFASMVIVFGAMVAACGGDDGGDAMMVGAAGSGGAPAIGGGRQPGGAAVGSAAGTGGGSGAAGTAGGSTSVGGNAGAGGAPASGAAGGGGTAAAMTGGGSCQGTPTSACLNGQPMYRWSCLGSLCTTMLADCQGAEVDRLICLPSGNDGRGPMVRYARLGKPCRSRMDCTYNPALRPAECHPTRSVCVAGAGTQCTSDDVCMNGCDTARGVCR